MTSQYDMPDLNKSQKAGPGSNVIPYGSKIRPATAGKAAEVWSLPRFWVSIALIRNTDVIRFCFMLAGPPWQGRQARFGPCLDFGFQYALIRNNRSQIFGVEYWTLPGSNSPRKK